LISRSEGSLVAIKDLDAIVFSKKIELFLEGVLLDVGG
jgi:hypothetical protein